MNSNIIIQN